MIFKEKSTENIEKTIDKGKKTSYNVSVKYNKATTKRPQGAKHESTKPHDSDRKSPAPRRGKRKERRKLHLFGKTERLQGDDMNGAR